MKIKLLTILGLAALVSCSEPTSTELIEPEADIPTCEYHIVNVSFFNVKRSDGSGGFTDAQVDAALDRLNEAFSHTKISFEETRAAIIEDDSIYYGGVPGLRAAFWVDLMNQRTSTTKIDIYLYPALSEEVMPGKFKRNFGNMVAVGGIIDGEAAAMTNIVAHEVGHALGLQHFGECGNVMQTVSSDPACIVEFNSKQAFYMRQNLLNEPKLANIAQSFVGPECQPYN